MNLHTLMLTKNECYQAATPIVPAGITLNDGVTRIWAEHGTVSMTYTPD